MSKNYLIGGVIGGVLVWLFLKPKCPPCPKCGSGGGNVSPQILPSIVVQPPAAPPPPPKPALGLPPAPPQNPIEPIEPPPNQSMPTFRGMAFRPSTRFVEPVTFTGEKTWAGWVK